MNRGGPSPEFDRREMRSMAARIVELERERAEARYRVAMLSSLQDAFTTIAVTRAPDEVIAHVLRAAYEPLGFRRAIYFTIDRERGLEAAHHIDGSDVVERCSEPVDVRSRHALLNAVRGDFSTETGFAGELSAPLVDVRDWYVVSPIVHAEKPAGVLYLDGNARARVPREWETSLVRALTTIASVSLANSTLFARTHALATRDGLTGLFNRRAFADRLLQELESAERQERCFAYVMIDVDDFKKVNDTYGHARGDEVLQRLGETLQRSLRGGDVAARFAGDEFVALLTDVDVELARLLVARLSAELRAADLRCSLGVALYPKDGTDAPALLGAADRALYATKAAGKNSYSFA